jgi:DNA-binding NtrC family response regulator
MVLNPAEIVVIDDDCLVRQFLVELLASRLGCRITAFASALEAWAHMENHGGGDVVVTDVNMPGMNGFDLMARMRKSFPEKSCILISGDPSNRRTAREMEADFFLSKPFRTDELLGAVELCVRESAQGAPDPLRLSGMGDLCSRRARPVAAPLPSRRPTS